MTRLDPPILSHFSIEKTQELIRSIVTITVIQPTSSYNNTTRLDPPIPSCSNTVNKEMEKKLTSIREEVSNAFYIYQSDQRFIKTLQLGALLNHQYLQNTKTESIYSGKFTSQRRSQSPKAWFPFSQTRTDILLQTPL